MAKAKTRDPRPGVPSPPGPPVLCVRFREASAAGPGDSEAGDAVGLLPAGKGPRQVTPTLGPVSSSQKWAYFLLCPPLNIVVRLHKMTWVKIPLKTIKN